MLPPCLLYSPQLTPRVVYSARLLGTLLGIPTVSCTPNWEIWQTAANCIRLNYSQRPSPSVPQLLPQGLLQASGIAHIRPEFKPHQGRMAAFFLEAPTAEALYPFDLLSLLFYLVSRYEEYLPHEADHWGRFMATSSAAFQYGFLDRPLLNEWALDLAKQLSHYYPQYQFATPSAYRFTPTYDIDHAYAFRGKAWWRQAGAAIRYTLNREGQALRNQWRTLWHPDTDPYNVYPLLDQLADQYQHRPLYFWLLGDYGPHDKNLPYNTPLLQALIQRQAARFPVGLHPSFGSNESLEQLTRERDRLAEITQRPVNRSRQHYLRLHLPTTYQRLQALNIREDYSMGYAQHLGFRASLATPYPWYDLEREMATKLKIFPFAIMDVTLRTYLGVSPEEALDHTSIIVERCKAVSGHLMSIWHNSSLGEQPPWDGWHAVYEAFLAQASE